MVQRGVLFLVHFFLDFSAKNYVFYTFNPFVLCYLDIQEKDCEGEAK